MIDAVIIQHGQPAQWCHQCKTMGKASTGEYRCSQPFGKCLYPAPALNAEGYLILKFLHLLRNQWFRVAGFSSERRAGIPFTDVQAAAQCTGLKLDYRRLEIINACISAIVADDIDAINQASQKG